MGGINIIVARDAGEALGNSVLGIFPRSLLFSCLQAYAIEARISSSCFCIFSDSSGRWTYDPNSGKCQHVMPLTRSDATTGNFYVVAGPVSERLHSPVRGRMSTLEAVSRDEPFLSVQHPGLIVWYNP